MERYKQKFEESNPFPSNWDIDTKAWRKDANYALKTGKIPFSKEGDRRFGWYIMGKASDHLYVDVTDNVDKDLNFLWDQMQSDFGINNK